MNCRRIVEALTGGMLVGLLVLGAVASFPAAWAEESTQSQVSRINQSLAGARTGILTQASGSVVQIDHTNYVLATQVVLEDVHGRPLEPAELIYEGGALSVQFWLGTGQANKQITQMQVAFPE